MEDAGLLVDSAPNTTIIFVVLAILGYLVITLWEYLSSKKEGREFDTSFFGLASSVR